MTENKNTKKRKTIKLIIGIPILCFIAAVALHYLYCFMLFATSRTRPDKQVKQKDCVWVSDDGKITIENDGTNHFTGTMKTDEGEVPLIIGFRAREYMCINRSDVADHIAFFSCRFRSPFRAKGKKFTAIVDSVDKGYEDYFEKAQKIVFHRVDK